MPSKAFPQECGIINLGSKFSKGFHWTAYIKNRYNIIYFDSFGDNSPPKELYDYFNVKNILYTHEKIQVKSYECGHLAIKFLAEYYSHQ